MKREYRKPEIMFEDFTLSTNIGGGCFRIIDNQSKGTCGIPGSAPNSDIFSSDIMGCDVYDWMVDGADDDMYNGLCYHVPSAGANLFNS